MSIILFPPKCVDGIWNDEMLYYTQKYLDEYW